MDGFFLGLWVTMVVGWLVAMGFCGWLCHGSLWVVLILNLGFVPSCAVG